MNNVNEMKKRLIEIFYETFNLIDYDMALHALNQYSKNFNLDDKELQFIYEAFIKPNLEELKDNFEHNKKLLSLDYNFEDVRYIIIPTQKEDKFYILDKKEIKIISIQKDIEVLSNYKDKFSDYSFIIENVNSEIYNPFIISDKLKNKNRSLYAVIDKEIEAFLQIKKYTKQEISNLKIFKNILEFEKYFLNSDDYFPRNIIFLNNRPINRLLEIQQRIHKHRILNKTLKKPLLTIAIPTIERGTFALSNIIHTLQSEFDYEIEVILSDNASTTLRQYYEDIANIKDSRLIYNKNEENVGFFGNLKKLIELSNAKYLMFNCDTDILQIEKLNILLGIIRDAKKDYSQIITNAKGKDLRAGYYEKRIDCVEKLCFTSNSLFGLLINKELIQNSNLIQYLDDNYDTSEYIIYYPQIVMDLFLLSHANTFVEEEEFIKEYPEETPYMNNSYGIYLDIDEFEDFDNFSNKVKSMYGGKNDLNKVSYVIGDFAKKNVLRCYTVAGRTMQHISGFKVLVDFFYKKDYIDEFSTLYLNFLLKTFFLIELNIKVNYLGICYKENIKYKMDKAIFYIQGINKEFIDLLEKANLSDEKITILKGYIEKKTDEFIRGINVLISE